MLVRQGDKAPRTGTYRVESGPPVEIDGRIFFALELKAGQEFPGTDDNSYTTGPLLSGELAPRDGTYAHSRSGLAIGLAAGDPFPEDDGKVAGDWIWVRECKEGDQALPGKALPISKV